MSSLNFPTTGLVPNVTTYTLGNVTYIWNGVAWAISKTNQTVGTLTATNVIYITGGAGSTSTLTGSLIITGGVGIGGDVYGTNFYSNGVLLGNSSTYATNLYGGSTGSLVIQDGTNVTGFIPIGDFGSVLYSNGFTATWVLASSISSNTSTNANNAYIQQTSEDRYAGGTFYFTLADVYDDYSPLSVQSSLNWNDTNSILNSPKITVTSTANAISVGTGALIVDGGASINNDLWLGGTLYTGGKPVLTTSSLVTAITSGTDISITYTNSGTLIISDVSTLQSVTNRGSTTTNSIHITNATTSSSTTTGALTVVGGVGVGGRINAESVQLSHAILDTTETTVNNTATIVVDTYSINDFRSAKYLIQIDEGDSPLRPGSANFEVIELLLLVDNSANVYATEYAVLTSTAGELGDFAADCDIHGNISLYFTAYNATNKILKVLRTALTV